MKKLFWIAIAGMIMVLSCTPEQTPQTPETPEEEYNRELKYTYTKAEDGIDMEVYLPTEETNIKVAVIACPGGSYSSHASHEGAVWAPYFNELGVAFAVLKYTLPAGDPSKPVGDMEIALSILNEMADKWLIDNVNRNTPQAFITYAKSETVVPPTSNGKAFYNAMIKAGAKAELLELNGTKHGWHHGNADHETAYLQPMKAKLTPWLQKL